MLHTTEQLTEITMDDHFLSSLGTAGHSKCVAQIFYRPDALPGICMVYMYISVQCNLSFQ